MTPGVYSDSNSDSVVNSKQQVMVQPGSRHPADIFYSALMESPFSDRNKIIRIIRNILPA